jgi:hypothetical protein
MCGPRPAADSFIGGDDHGCKPSAVLLLAGGDLGRAKLSRRSPLSSHSQFTLPSAMNYVRQTRKMTTGRKVPLRVTLAAK